MLAVIDYGGGNLGSLLAALERRNAPFVVTADPDAVRRARAVILPGDGAFAATIEALEERGLDRAIHDAIGAAAPFLGICVGMQILFDASEEFGTTRGLGILRGTVARFVDAPRVPHMGWNRLERTGDHPFVEGIGGRDYAYFMHSYRVSVGDETVATATHGERFSAIVARENVMGTQFHPEKSQRTGMRLLDNFLRFAKEKSP
ncbi:MAG: imidazole glycerol phosphate synthase subunit HisH [Candidatus Eremiobacteraeota bacterium]|nr:imidazole glycerol phosphate synthase subunit HisH [Candidatus Eremiobacteraeota bacterium]